MPELNTNELYRYRVHAVPREIHAYKMLVRDVADNGIKEPVTILCDGTFCALEEGHKRVEAAMQLGIRTVPVEIRAHRFGHKRRYKFAIGPGLAQLITERAAPPPPDPQKTPAKKSTARAKRPAAKGRTSSSKDAATVRR